MESSIEQSLIGCTDAQVWAREFCSRFQVHKLFEDDTGLAEPIEDAEGLMIGWFANALMSAYDEGVKHERARPIVEKLHELTFQVAGVATMPLLEDHPDYVFPSDRVADAVNHLLPEFGIPIRGN